MAKRQLITGPGVVMDRAAKKGKLKLAFDPSPGGFVSDARQAHEKVKVTIVAEDDKTKPIEIYASAKLWCFQFEGATIPKDRLSDLERLITDDADVHVTIEYTPQQDDLPGMEGKD